MSTQTSSSGGKKRRTALATEDNYLDEAGGSAEATVSLLTFVVAGETYGLPITVLREIIKLREITEVPRVPSFILGVITVRGQVIPVVDLRRRLKLDATPPTRVARILVVMHDNSLLGFLVDAVTGVVRLPESAFEATPSTLSVSEGHFLSGVFRHEYAKKTRLIILLDLDSLARFELRRRAVIKVGA